MASPPAASDPTEQALLGAMRAEDAAAWGPLFARAPGFVAGSLFPERPALPVSGGLRDVVLSARSLMEKVLRDPAGSGYHCRRGYFSPDDDPVEGCRCNTCLGIHPDNCRCFDCKVDTSVLDRMLAGLRKCEACGSATGRGSPPGSRCAICCRGASDALICAPRPQEPDGDPRR